MKVYRSQDEALDAVLESLADGEIVRVWSEPERPLQPHERMCLEEDDGEVVVYHPRSEQHGIAWRICLDCGEVGSESGEEVPSA